MESILQTIHTTWSSLILWEFLQKALPNDITQFDMLPFFKGSNFQAFNKIP